MNDAAAISLEELLESIPAEAPLAEMLPLIELLHEELGITVLLKWDTERDPEAGDTGRFTAVLSGKNVPNDFIRRDDASMSLAIRFILEKYCRECNE